ncbi:tetratricopeptide repeat protein [Rufibacter sediminis]|uniref:Sel1 repeat family protein n=1 Tax=Rufibacter sediminis TaxID=2762756 RepID=A0ABR6VQC1_9BACT|nr:sel1 repeat family protein [Rufibacter sediminis]MBC3539336.1 sel1 repeat family protein [Rufibacter sediminis]
MKKAIALTSILVLTLLKSFGQTSDFEEGLKSFDAKDYKKAITLLKPYADKGNCTAQFVMGYTYQYGLAVEKNDALALHWLAKSAEQKQPAAMGPLAALLFSNALKDRKVIVQAYLWAMLAAEYSVVQKHTSTRYVIKGHLKEDEIQAGDQLLEKYKLNWKNKENCN